MTITTAAFVKGIDECCRFAERNFGVEMEEMRSFVYSGIEHATEQIRIYIVPGIFNYSMRYLKKAMDAALFLLMVFVAAILLMRDYDRMREQLRNYRLYRHVEHISGRMWHQGGMYLKAQAMIIGIVSILCVLGLWLLGNPYFVLLGVAAGLWMHCPLSGQGRFCSRSRFSLYCREAMQRQRAMVCCFSSPTWRGNFSSRG